MFTTLPQSLIEANEQSRPQVVDQSPVGLIATKRLVWLYFWLLIFEGALRKWILPGLSNPLLIIRDPVVVAIYVVAGTSGLFPKNGFVIWTAGLGLTCFLASEIGGEGNLLVSLFGLRTNFLHLPLIFLLPNVFGKEDLEKMAKWFFISSIPMCLLVLAQFQASPDHWLNRGAGGAENGQLESAYGKIRPPGTFSFTVGLASYLCVGAAFAVWSLMQQRSKNQKLANIALPALAVMVGVSGSRSALSSIVLIFFATAVICIKKPVFFGRSAKLIFTLGVAYFVLGFWSEFQQGLAVHAYRFGGIGEVKEGIIIRFFTGLLPLGAISNASAFGAGLGMGTNAAASFMFGRGLFSLGETDWERIIGESGPILGLTFIGFRIAIVAHLAIRSFDALKRDSPLPLLLFAAAAPLVLSGQLGIPTILGWTVFSAALCLASMNTGSEPAIAPTAVKDLVESPPGGPNFRGRSIYADQLHGEIEDPEIARYGP